MARFYHIGTNVVGTEKIRAVDGALDVIAPDWFRYTYTNWLVWTDKTAQQLTDQLRPVLPTSHYLILPIDSTQQLQGYVPQDVWTWLNRYRPPGFTAAPTNYLGRTLPNPPGPPGPLLPPRKY